MEATTTINSTKNELSFNNIDDILNSTEFNEMFDFEAEKKEIEKAGWTMEEVKNFALSIKKK